VESIRQGSARRHRLLIGTDLDESALFIGPHPANDPGSRDLGNMRLEQFRPIEEEYRRIYPALSDEMLRIRSLTAEEYWIPSLRVADAQVKSGGIAYVYRFDYAQGTGRFAGLAFHSSELRFVWDRILQPTVSTEALQLAATIHDAWSSFIRGEAPQAVGLPPWPPYSLRNRPTMILNGSSRVEDKPQEAEIKAWSSLLTQ
jgi:para-nitrobenzyl esterase